MFAKILVDIIIIGILVLGVVLGLKRGFIITIARPVKWFMAFFLAILLCTPVSNGIIEPLIDKPINNQLSGYLIDKCGDITAENAGDKLPTVLKFAAEIADVDFESMEGNSSEEIIAALVDKLSAPIVSLISGILAFILVYFVSKILLAIALRVLDGMFRNGLLGVFNKTLGCIFGAAFSFVCAWLFVSVFGYVINIPVIAETGFGKSFDGGYIYGFFKSMSPLDILLSF